MLALLLISNAARAQLQQEPAPSSSSPAPPPAETAAPPSTSEPQPIAAPPRRESEDEPEERNSGFGYALAGGLGYGRSSVDLGSKYTTNGVGAFFHGGGSFFTSKLTGRARLSGFFGGGGGGAESAYSGEAWIGGGTIIGGISQLFFRAGAEGYAFKNDELEASTASIPAAQLGYQLWADGFGFEIAPRVGLSARSEYEPGDEKQGRRHWRRIDLRASYGGGAMITSKYFFLDGSFSRIADSDPLTVVDGRFCFIALLVAICGHGQYWQSTTQPPTNAPMLDVTSFYFGGAIGLGLAGSGDEGPFRSPKPGKPANKPASDAPKPDAPKLDAPKPDAPKPDAPKPDAPKLDAPKPEGS